MKHAIPTEHHALVRTLIRRLRDERIDNSLPDATDDPKLLASLPGWDDYVAEDLSPRMWAAVLETALRASAAAQLIPGATYVPDDCEQPLVRIVGRTARGVRFLLGDTLWHYRADHLAGVLERTGYRREVAS